MKKYIPNVLTSYRTIIAFLIPFLFFDENYYLLAVLFFIALITDLFDGYLARKWNVVSLTGKVLDVIGDKLLAVSAASTFIVFIDIKLLLLLIGEVTIILVGSYYIISTKSLKTKNFNKFQSSIYGKFKTWLLFVTLGMSFVSYKVDILKPSLLPLIIITFILQLITAYNYFESFNKIKKS